MRLLRYDRSLVGVCPRYSGKTAGWFMGDAVHVNGCGYQIIGRLLESWLED
jgi:lysophospholipase L1-like esterase